MMGTSKASPFATCFLVPRPDPKVGLTLWPVLRSKPGMSCSTAALMPPGATSVTSLFWAPAAVFQWPSATTTIREGSNCLISLAPIIYRIRGGTHVCIPSCQRSIVLRRNEARDHTERVGTVLLPAHLFLLFLPGRPRLPSS